jgi:hypothetical protein
LKKFDFISNKLTTGVRDINHYMPTKYYKGERFLLDEIYGQIEANEAKLDQLEDQIRWDYYYASDEVYEERNFIIQKLYKQNDELWSDYHEIYYRLYGNSPKHVSPQQYSYDHLIENDQYGYDHLVENDQYDYDHLVKNDQCGQSINNQVIDFNRHEMSNDPSLDWNEAIRIFKKKFLHQSWNPRKIPINFSKMKH